MRGWVLSAAAVALTVATAEGRAELGALGEDAPPDGWTARQILDRAHENWIRLDTLAHIRLRVVSRSGRVMEQRIEAARQTVRGQLRTLVRLTYPPDLRGTTLLILGNVARADDVFLYLPTQRRVLRVPAPRRGDRFLGTDLSFEDVGGSLDLGDYRLERLPTEESPSGGVYVVRAEPSDARKRDARRYRISTRTFVVLGVDYERHGRVVQRLEVDPDSVREIAADTWVPTRVVMRNLVTGTRTELEVERVEVEPALAADLFSVSRLERLARTGLPLD